MKYHYNEFVQKKLRPPVCAEAGRTKGGNPGRVYSEGLHWWSPTKSQVKYVQAYVKSGLSATQRELAGVAGVAVKSVEAWHRSQHFVEWKNKEVIRRLTVGIPGRVAYVLDRWLKKLVRDIRAYDQSNGSFGRYPTQSEVKRLLDLADRFNLVDGAKGGKRVTFNLVQVVGAGPMTPGQLRPNMTEQARKVANVLAGTEILDAEVVSPPPPSNGNGDGTQP